MSLHTKHILGVRVDDVTWSDIDAFCLAAFNGKQPKQIVTVNGEFVLDAQHNSEFKAVINQADLVIPDSTNVTWFGRLKATTPGSDLTVRLCQLAAEHKQSVFLLGAYGTVAEQAAKMLQKHIPALKIAGHSNADPTDPHIVATIKKSGADILFVAYGAPAQELWIAKHKHETGAKILVGVGGTFDMLAGTLPRAPKLIRAIHLEWLWRLTIQPSRWKRIWRALVVFPLTVLTQKH